MMAFKIEWSTSSQRWSKWRELMSLYGPGDEFDTKGRAYGWSPGGTIQMECDGQLMFPQQLRIWWVLERTPEARERLGYPDLDNLPEIRLPPFAPFYLAYRFEQLLSTSFGATLDRDSRTWVSDDESERGFLFEDRMGYVRITAGIWERSVAADGTLQADFVRDECSCQLVVKGEEFRTELERFINGYIAELLHYVPEFESWETLRPFERFMRN